jgi:ATP-dependent protease ClpP protease subunit
VPSPIITTTPQVDHTCIRYSGPITADGAFALVTESEIALDYYSHLDLEWQIDSPGGDYDAFVFVAAWLEERRARTPDFTLTTVALVRCASAGAALVALGSHGRRYSRPGARLLFHRPRVIVGREQAITAGDMRLRHAELAEVDREFIDRLFRHVRPADAAARDRLVALLDEERWIDGDEAARHGLIDSCAVALPPLVQRAASVGGGVITAPARAGAVPHDAARAA